MSSTVLGPEDTMLSVEGVARVLGVSARRATQLIAEGAFPSKKIGRLRRVWLSDLRSWVDKQ